MSECTKCGSRITKTTADGTPTCWVCGRLQTAPDPKDTLISELREAVGVLAEYAERGECSAICAQVCPACAKVAAMLANPTAKQAVEAARARSQK